MVAVVAAAALSQPFTSTFDILAVSPSLSRSHSFRGKCAAVAVNVVRFKCLIENLS